MTVSFWQRSSTQIKSLITLNGRTCRNVWQNKKITLSFLKIQTLNSTGRQQENINDR